jgi:hypothetical protein
MLLKGCAEMNCRIQLIILPKCKISFIQCYPGKSGKRLTFPPVWERIISTQKLSLYQCMERSYENISEWYKREYMESFLEMLWAFSKCINWGCITGVSDTNKVPFQIIKRRKILRTSGQVVPKWKGLSSIIAVKEKDKRTPFWEPLKWCYNVF